MSVLSKIGFKGKALDSAVVLVGVAKSLQFPDSALEDNNVCGK
jgi:hypothetical protein